MRACPEQIFCRLSAHLHRMLGSACVQCTWQVSKLLSGSGLLLKAQVILAAAEALWRDVQPVITAAKQQGLCPADMFSRPDITWATGICLSRSIRLDDRGGEVVLCPFADLFNHSCDSQAFLLWDKQQQAVVLRADKAYKAGEQVRRVVGCQLSWRATFILTLPSTHAGCTDTSQVASMYGSPSAAQLLWNAGVLLQNGQPCRCHDNHRGGCCFFAVCLRPQAH